MRVHKIILSLSLLLIMLAIGCTQPARNAGTSQPATIASSTGPMTTTPKPTLTPTIVPTNTLTAIPILSEEEARAKLLDLLANNGDCRLPCLWGIIPGKTTYLKARAILLPFSSISRSTHLNDNSPDSTMPTYIDGDLRITTNLRYLYGNDGIVSRIVFSAEETKEIPNGYLPIYDSKTFGERLHPYMLPGILSELGKPESVVLHTYGKRLEGSGNFEIVLLYPEQGTLVHYTTQMEVVGANARGCPANAQVELELYPSGDAASFIKSLSSTTWAAFVLPDPIDDSHWRLVENATSMSVEQFYETFRQPTDKCIETPLKGWYVPQ